MMLILPWGRSVSRSRTARRTTKRNAKQRFEDFRAGVYMQTLLRDPAAGVMHSFIYFGFIALFIATVISETDHQMPGSLKFWPAV